MADGKSTVGEVRVAPDRLHAFTMAICRADGSSEPRRPGWSPTIWCWPTCTATTATASA